MPQYNVCTHATTQWSAEKKNKQKTHPEATWGGAAEITSVLSGTPAVFIRNCLGAHETTQEVVHGENAEVLWE